MRLALLAFACFFFSASVLAQESLDDLEKRLQNAKREDVRREEARRRDRESAMAAAAERDAAERRRRDEARERDLAKTGGCSLDHFRYASVRVERQCSGMRFVSEYLRTRPGMGRINNTYFPDGRPAVTESIDVACDAGVATTRSAKTIIRLPEFRPGESTAFLSGQLTVGLRATEFVGGQTVEAAGYSITASEMTASGKTLVGTPGIELGFAVRWTAGGATSCEVTRLDLLE